MSLKGLLDKLHMNWHRKQRDEDLQGRPSPAAKGKLPVATKIPPSRAERRTKPEPGFRGYDKRQKGCFGKPKWMRAEGVAP
jgi:hypothetical protein